MVQTLPKDYFLRERNREYYVNEKIHEKLHFLNLFPIVNNDYGEFTQYITDANADVETEDPRGIGEGVNFAESNFGTPSKKQGSLVAKGFKFSWTDKVVTQGRLNANMQIWLSKAVSRLAKFYDARFAASIMELANATAPNDLSDWTDSTAIDPVGDELKIINAYEEDGYGYEPAAMYLNNNDMLARNNYIASFPYEVKHEMEYFNFGKAIPEGKALILPSELIANIEKHTSKNYSVIRQAEITSEKTGKQLQNVPESFINVWYPPMTKPGVHECYLWCEAAVNMLESKGAMVVDLDGS